MRGKFMYFVKSKDSFELEFEALWTVFVHWKGVKTSAKQVDIKILCTDPQSKVQYGCMWDRGARVSVICYMIALPITQAQLADMPVPQPDQEPELLTAPPVGLPRQGRGSVGEELLAACWVPQAPCLVLPDDVLLCCFS